VTQPVVNFIDRGYFLDTTLYETVRVDFLFCAITWPLFFLWYPPRHAGPSPPTSCSDSSCADCLAPSPCYYSTPRNWDSSCTQFTWSSPTTGAPRTPPSSSCRPARTS
jgi:hypothetical protein